VRDAGRCETLTLVTHFMFNPCTLPKQISRFYGARLVYACCERSERSYMERTVSEEQWQIGMYTMHRCAVEDIG
jgi:hypothetical protein